jgi:hypothetical protein
MLVRVRSAEGLQLIAVESIVRVITPDDPTQGVKVALVNGATIALDQKEGRRLLAFLDGNIIELPAIDDNGRVIAGAAIGAGHEGRPRRQPGAPDGISDEQKAAALNEASKKAPETAAAADKAA